MAKTILLLALITMGCFSAGAADVAGKSDAEIRKQLLGLWRSPRHEYEFRPNGIIYMLPATPDTTTSPWSVKNGHFYWDKEACVIVTLTGKKFVYRSLPMKSPPTDFVLVRITRDMVGKPYSRESVK